MPAYGLQPGGHRVAEGRAHPAVGVSQAGAADAEWLLRPLPRRESAALAVRKPAKITTQPTSIVSQKSCGRPLRAIDPAIPTTMSPAAIRMLATRKRGDPLRRRTWTAEYAATETTAITPRVFRTMVMGSQTPCSTTPVP